jgi:hypothetical protein
MKLNSQNCLMPKTHQNRFRSRTSPQLCYVSKVAAKADRESWMSYQYLSSTSALRHVIIHKVTPKVTRFPKHNVHRDHGASESVQTIGHHEGGSEECSNDTKTKASTRAEGVKRRPRHEGGGEECWRSKNTTSTKAQG